jgi:UDP-GlcNAc:undecaprenyl-phosphate/decaprenyl-phosphate GlcNAc-1-phosphate transferase
VLSIMGGAKLALALMVLGVPILDVAVVIINRVRRGQSPLHYDMTHLHHRLLATGLSVKQICWVIYGLALVFGLLALLLSGNQNAHFLKLVGIVLVGLTMVGVIAWIDYRQRQRGVRIQLDGPEQPAGHGGGEEEDEEERSPVAGAAGDLDDVSATTTAGQAGTGDGGGAGRKKTNPAPRNGRLQARLPR